MSLSEAILNSLAIGTIIKIIWDYNIPNYLNFCALFGFMLGSLFSKKVRLVIAIVSFLIFYIPFYFNYHIEARLMIDALAVFIVIQILWKS